ncbi:PQQ-binding-like beta-propeller repeat protein [Paraburkholderia silviterrae]|uniref:PQQ-binding-like beta-propeller repeat protein n=1 Tax=Paraburkholderia silviterrae TaxID=2528715 RepID=UPI00196B62E5|nr:PQQ-binding-like beta-propeller repeat protein [Paraburkholderia silviterrae]
MFDKQIFDRFGAKTLEHFDDVGHNDRLAAHANMYALDAATGEIKWSFESGGAVVSGAAIVDGTVYWGSGYHTKVLGLPYAGDNHKLDAFAVPKQ